MMDVTGLAGPFIFAGVVAFMGTLIFAIGMISGKKEVVSDGA